MDDTLPTVSVTMRFLALCERHGSRRATVGLLAEGRRAGVPGLPGDDDWTRWTGAQMRAAVEYLEGGRDAAPRAEQTPATSTTGRKTGGGDDHAVCLTVET